ncbi:MAG: SDR family oxidoreductase [Solirubrobacterales bacterium]|nr:SDR family oxidoreductase [Solirubrobacterales bacterium]
MLEGRRLLVTGVVTRGSIAFEVARQAQEAGAEVLLTGFGRARRLTERAAAKLPEPADVLELDVNSPEDLATVAEEVGARWGALDGVLHAVAFAPEDALGGRFLTTPVDSAVTAFRTSAYSLKAVVEALLYDWMGVSKAALESVSRYLARDVGAQGVRVNLVSAGPIRTLAAGGIPGFDRLADAWGRQAPLGWDTADAAPVAAAACFLLSEHARAITGEVLHVDGGYHAMGAALHA